MHYRQWKTGELLFCRTRTAFQVTLQGERHRLVARIDVIDTGAGIPPHLQDTLFTRMVSGREGEMALVYPLQRSLVDQHAGKIGFAPDWPGIPSFLLLANKIGDNQCKKGNIWVVDDDSSIRWVLERAITREGLTCKTFEHANDVPQCTQ